MIKQAIGYLILLAILFILWGSAFILGQKGEIGGFWVAFGLGSIFALILLSLIVYQLLQRRKKSIVLRDYALIESQLLKVEDQDGRYFYVHTVWLDPETEVKYYFKSDYVEYDPTEFLLKRTIPVKISRRNYKLYLVDLSFLPKLA
ncbi:hypothetical protein DC083_06445 [Ignatzschineria ureiclastica]|uniref:DUF3592 domain-containing protein n=1 Tax=Ignatzschineria ureiclastica TaxID=472582 RepID=A0A2U2ADL2_9GAMM|nr:hypothetical protein [Ignatzschineria ureiclastica]PWD80746.1 hypothetical protein DC083_06445 [Ignatzschineria ureiclastica]GGZ94897.1 hypothetical protein GCM10007162_08630 [Ignatzschineria ureiclastica]